MEINFDSYDPYGSTLNFNFVIAELEKQLDSIENEIRGRVSSEHVEQLHSLVLSRFIDNVEPNLLEGNKQMVRKLL